MFHWFFIFYFLVKRKIYLQSLPKDIYMYGVNPTLWPYLTKEYNKVNQPRLSIADQPKPKRPTLISRFNWELNLKHYDYQSNKLLNLVEVIHILYLWIIDLLSMMSYYIMNLGHISLTWILISTCMFLLNCIRLGAIHEHEYKQKKLVSFI